MGFKIRTNVFLLDKAARSFFVFYCFPFLFFLPICCYCGAGVVGLLGYDV